MNLRDILINEYKWSRLIQWWIKIGGRWEKSGRKSQICYADEIVYVTIVLKLHYALLRSSEFACLTFNCEFNNIFFDDAIKAVLFQNSY